MLGLRHRPAVWIHGAAVVWIHGAAVVRMHGIRSGPRRRIPGMAFDISAYKARTERLRWDDLDLGAFRTAPLDPDALRCIRYMHDIEYHTVCYLRDLLVGPAHDDPEVTAFLSFWAYEELWHGEALAAVLEAHGEAAGDARISGMRRRLSRRERLRTFLMMMASMVAGRDFVAVHMSWGAVNEWTTQAGYTQLARRAGHPVLTELVGRIARQEGRHIDFYSTQAQTRLAASRRARRMTRWALRHLWAPVGSGAMPKAEVAHMASYLFSGPEGAEMAARIDRRIDRLPGLSGLGLLTGSVTGNGGGPAGPGPSERPAQPRPELRAA